MMRTSSLAALVGREVGTASTGSIIETMLATNGQWLVTVHNSQIVKFTHIPPGEEVQRLPVKENVEGAEEEETEDK